MAKYKVGASTAGFPSRLQAKHGNTMCGYPSNMLPVVREFWSPWSKAEAQGAAQTIYMGGEHEISKSLQTMQSSQTED